MAENQQCLPDWQEKLTRIQGWPQSLSLRILENLISSNQDRYLTKVISIFAD